jgi:hypothetical protein
MKETAKSSERYETKCLSNSDYTQKITRFVHGGSLFISWIHSQSPALIVCKLIIVFMVRLNISIDKNLFCFVITNELGILRLITWWWRYIMVLKLQTSSYTCHLKRIPLIIIIDIPVIERFVLPLGFFAVVHSYYCLYCLSWNGIVV